MSWEVAAVEAVALAVADILTQILCEGEEGSFAVEESPTSARPGATTSWPSLEGMGGPSLWVRMTVEGEEFLYRIFSHGESIITREMLAGYIDALEEWIPQTAFSWGSRRAISLEGPST